MVAEKQLKVKAFAENVIESQHIIPKMEVDNIKGTVDFSKISDKSLYEINNLTITKVEWQDCLLKLGFTRSDGESCKVGTCDDLTKSHSFDPTKKITCVDVTISMTEAGIKLIKFWHNNEILVQLGDDERDQNRMY